MFQILYSVPGSIIKVDEVLYEASMNVQGGGDKVNTKQFINIEDIIGRMATVCLQNSFIPSWNAIVQVCVVGYWTILQDESL